MADTDLHNAVFDDYRASIRTHQMDARYRQLLAAHAAPASGIVYQSVRTGTGLISIALLHESLSPAQLEELGEFRLQQHILCGFYDLAVVHGLGISADPALEKLPPGTVHTFVGTGDGRILAYFYMQPATGANSLAVRMGDTNRPLFPCETESFGPEPFSSLPGLSDLPVAHVRELSVLVRNQVVQSPLSTAAVIEAIHTMARVQMHPDLAIEATLGCVDREARQVSEYLGMPALYAPLAPVIRNDLAFYWAQGANASGRFWPFVFATADLCAQPEHFAHMDAMLALPERELRRGLIQWRREAQALAPQRFTRDLDTSPVLWTADPAAYDEALAPERNGTRQPAAAPRERHN